MNATLSQLVQIPADTGFLEGMLELPPNARGVVLFAHGSGSSRLSPRNNFVAEKLREGHVGTLLVEHPPEPLRHRHHEPDDGLGDGTVGGTTRVREDDVALDECGEQQDLRTGPRAAQPLERFLEQDALVRRVLVHDHEPVANRRQDVRAVELPDLALARRCAGGDRGVCKAGRLLLDQLRRTECGRQLGARISALSSTRISPMSFIAYPTSATLSDLHAVTAAAARAQRPTSARNVSLCQSSVSTLNRRPARTMALAVSCAPCTPWL